MDEHKLAKALGIIVTVYQSPNGPLYGLCGDNVSWSEVLDWLDSATGEKAVRDRVRELCDDTYELEYSWDQYYQGSMRIGYHRIALKPDFGCSCDTEAEAWNEALIWLAERVTD